MIAQERIETNQLLMEMVGLDLTSKSLTDNLQAERYYTLLSEHIESQIQSAINWIDSDSAREFFFNDAYHQAEIWDSLEDDWDNILSGKYETIDDLLEEVYDYGKSRGYSDMAETLRYTPTDRLAFAFARNYNYGLIQNLDNDLRGAIKDRMTQAAIQGENPYSLAPHLRKLGLTQLPGSTFTPYQRAVLIARTETSRIQNTGILQSYVNEGYTRVKILTACDDHVCTVCLRYAFEFNSSDKVTFENRGEERTHNIRDLLKGGSYPPFHPLCRCTYLSVWESKGPVPDEPYMVNLTPIDNWEDAFDPTVAPPLKPSSNKITLDWDDLASPQDVADYFGYEYSFESQPQVPEQYRIMNGSDGRRYNVGRNQNTGKFHKFYDRENDCSIYVHQSLGKLDKKTNNILIDTTNGGKGLYDLKTVIKMYHDAPTILKENNTTITFSNRKAKRILAYNKILPGDWLKVLDDNELSKYVTSGRSPVWIDIFKNGIDSIPTGHTLQRTLYHEMAHGWDMNPSRDPKGSGAISNDRNPGGYGELCYQQHNFNEDTRRMEVSDKSIVDGLSSEYGVRHYNKTDSYSEDFADAVSMVSFKNIPKDNAIILKPNYKYDNEPYTYSEWVSKYPHKVERLEKWMGLR